jgi:aromatic-L-amino-acid/L-tryptophan decarboxylase
VELPQATDPLGALTRELETNLAPVERLTELLRAAITEYGDYRDSSPVGGKTVRKHLPRPEVLAHGRGALAAFEALTEQLRDGQNHVSARRYFGLFNTAVSPLVAVVDAIVSMHNPQLATERSAPFSVAIERELLAAFGARVGLASGGGTFTCGGAEANHTALLCALAAKAPKFIEKGLRALPKEPVLYMSSEGHDSVVKAAVASGLGREAVRKVPVDQWLDLDPGRVRAAIRRDKREGRLPLMLVATLGTTSTGALDPIAELSRIAREEGLWFHIDGAWGSLLALRRDSSLLDLGTFDSLTWDAHKTLPVPIATSMLLLREPKYLHDVFHVQAGYVSSAGAAEPYTTSMRWSRAALGLRIWVLLQAYGWSGMTDYAEHLFALGDVLKAQVATLGLQERYRSPLPIIAVEHSGGHKAHEALRLAALEHANAWVSVTMLSTGRSALRACIAHGRPRPADIEALIEALRRAL